MNTNFGFVRVAAAVPTMKVANCKYNAEQIKPQIDEAIAEGVEVICFPELSLTGYTCADDDPHGPGERTERHRGRNG